jgi:hypothetical protein
MAILPVHQFSVLAGASGCGKTTLILQAWAEHEAGRKFCLMFDPYVKKAGVIIADRTKSEAVSRCKHLGIKDIEIYGIVDDFTLSTDLIRRPEDLWHAIQKKLRPDNDLLIIDPIGLFMEGSLIDYKSVASTLIGFNRYAMRERKTLLGIHHTTKARTDSGFLRPQDRISGSGAFPGYSSTQCMMIEGLEEKQEGYDKLIIVPHMSPIERYRLVRKPDGYFTCMEENAKEEMMGMMETTKAMKLSEFKSQAAIKGLTDEDIQEWLESAANLVVEDGFVVKT